MQYPLPTLSFTSLILLGATGCEIGAFGDAEQNAGVPMHEVYLEGADGKQTTLGYYDSEGGMFYESATLDLPHKSVFVETQNDELALFPRFGVDNQETNLDVSSSYPVYTYADHTSDDPDEWEWERVDLGTAYVAPEASTRSIDIEESRGVGLEVLVGTAVIETCRKVSMTTGQSTRSGHVCTVAAWDNQAIKDDLCTGVFAFWNRKEFTLQNHVVTSCDEKGNHKTGVFAGWGDIPRLTVYVCPVKDAKPGPGRNWQCVPPLVNPGNQRAKRWFEVTLKEV